MEVKIDKNRERSKILVVDDEEGIRSQLKWALTNEYDVFLAKDADESLKLIKTEAPNLVTLDIALSCNGKEEGINILKEIIKLSPNTKVIMITGNDKKDTALKSIQFGAYDYYHKPINVNELKIIIKRAIKIQKMELENEALSDNVEKKYQFKDIIGNSLQMLEIFDILKRVISTNVPVLICGESGTGKELVARALYNQSRRQDKPFIAINCGAIPENLLESELFGHEKGAFTGAYYKKKGKFELAHEGTAFLDEIGELSPTLQVKLLRFLQEKEIERVGGKGPITVDVRILAATNKDLQEEIKKQNFRIDLFYRLSVITVTLPPLRERGDDILLLANCFLNKYGKEYNKKIRFFDVIAIEKMQHYNWPGNVRELENRVRRAVIMNQNGIIGCEDLGLGDNMRADRVSLTEVVDELQKKHINMALIRTQGNVSKAARQLGISRVTLYDLLNRFNIQVNYYRRKKF